MINQNCPCCGGECILTGDLDEAEFRVQQLEEALKRIRDHDKIILGEHMDQVRQIAREALE